MNIWENLRYKIFGDQRDQRVALRDAGFADEAAASAWARSLVPDASASEIDLVRRIRQERPDLTGRTASYIARQVRSRIA